MRDSETRTKLENLEPSSFARLIYSEIEEIGWEHLVHFSPNLRFFSFRVTDKNGRLHILEIQLNDNYPHFSPSFSADVPYLFNAEWSPNSRLKDLVEQFKEHLDKLQEFWSTLDDIDKSLCITDLKLQSRSSSYRKIDAGDKCFLILDIDAKYPRSLLEVRFMGAGPIINTLRKLWQRNSKRWMEGKTVVENLTSILEEKLPRPAAIENIDKQIECGICYAQCLPVDDELGPRSGTGTDYTCDSANCSRAFHSVCLQDWLLSITTTRQSFNVLFGNCPYCSEPVAIKIQNSRK